MKTPREIYEHFRIMPALQRHQLRVAAVAQMLAEVSKKVNEREIVLACLFHDMGNIVKADLQRFPEFLEPEGRAYWEQVQSHYLNTYGTDAHQAAAVIAREIGLSESVRALIDAIDFSQLERNLRYGSLDIHICQYADMRVGPHGVLPLEERVAEARERYRGRRDVEPGIDSTEEEFGKLYRAAQGIEDVIFSKLSLKPTDITSATVESRADHLLDYAL